MANSGVASSDNLRAAAEQLLSASTTGQPCSPIRDLVGSDNIADSYSVQVLVNRNAVERGARRVGRKIGLTSPAVQKQLGVDQPDFGELFAHMLFRNEARIPPSVLMQPKAEAEVAFVLKDDLIGENLEYDQVREAIDFATAAIEIVDSRIADWDITITDTIADNASSGVFVLGDQKASLSEFEPRNAEMSLYVDETLCSEGSGHECLGDPISALTWLARTAQAFGAPLQAGEVVLSGALGPMTTVSPGAQLKANISGLGQVTATIEGRNQ